MRLFIPILILYFIKLSCSQTQTWTEQNSGVTTHLNSVSVTPYLQGATETVWVCGDSGVVLRSTDLGITWLGAHNGIQNYYQMTAICALDEYTAFAAAYAGLITWVFKTTNGGSSWNQSLLLGVDYAYGIGTKASNTSYCILLGEPIYGRWPIFVTTNKGSSWDSTGRSFPRNGNNELSFQNALYVNRVPGNENHVWFGTNNYHVYRSSDFGYTWSMQTMNPNQNTCVLSFVDSIGLSGGSVLLGTTNYGSNWFIVPNQPAGSGNIDGLVGFTSSVSQYQQYLGQCWYTRGDANIYTGNSIYGNYYITYSAPSGSYTNMNSGGYNGPIWAIRDDGGISACLDCMIVGLTPVSDKIPNSFELRQNYPNPFNPVTKINYAIPKDSRVKIEIYDILGRLVRTLLNDSQKAGYYSVFFDGTNLVSGIYFCRIEAGTFVSSKKMVLLK